MNDPKSRSKSAKTFKQHLVDDLQCQFCLSTLDNPLMTECKLY